MDAGDISPDQQLNFSAVSVQLVISQQGAPDIISQDTLDVSYLGPGVVGGDLLHADGLDGVCVSEYITERNII